MCRRMLIVLLSVAIFFSRSSALTPNEWRGVTTEIFSNETRLLYQGLFDQISDYLSDDAEVLYPKTHLAEKEGASKAQEHTLEKRPIEYAYLDNVDLIYSSPDVAVITDLIVERLRNGSYAQARGLALFVQKEGRIKIHMNIFNYMYGISD